MGNHDVLKPDHRLVRKIQEACGCSDIAATIIANRQIKSRVELDLFLDPKLNRMRSPLALYDTDKAVARIHRALAEKEKILVFCDYDADGVCSGAVMIEALREFGGDVEYFIPNRHSSGRGLAERHITQYALPQKIDLIITVDCGSSAAAPVALAAKNGIDVIITDHHEVDPATAPEAIALVNPKREEDNSGLDDLAGVGVAFYLMICLRSYLRGQGYFNDRRPEPDLKQLIDIVCIGTVADCVPLVADNRILVNTGIDILKRGDNRPGIAALMAVAGMEPTNTTSVDIAFKIAPRINAASRMKHAKIALDLLLTRNPGEAKTLAEELDQLNVERKQAVENIMEDIENILCANPSELEGSTIVMADADWTGGILGIVAGRIADKYRRPTIIFSLRDNGWVGSARSVPGFDIYHALTQISQQGLDFGGHSQAAGLRVDRDHFKSFKAALEQYATSVGFVAGEPKIAIDCEIGFEEISEELLDELQHLGPFGQGNPEPVFLSRGVRSTGIQILRGGHRRMYLGQPLSESERTYPAVFFNIDDDHYTHPDNYDAVAYRLEWNHWRGNRSIQFMLVDIAA